MRYFFSMLTILLAFQAGQAQVSADMGEFQFILPDGGEFFENSKKEVDWMIRPEDAVATRATTLHIERVKNLDVATLEEVFGPNGFEGVSDREAAFEDFAQRKNLSQLEGAPEGVTVYYADYNDVGWLRIVLIETSKRMYLGYIAGPDNELNNLREDILTSME